MKKIYFIIIFLIILVIVSLFVFNNRVVSIITLDINPSIQINLDKNERVKKVIALNSDAKDIVKGNFRNKSFNDVIDSITDNVVEKGYADNDQIVVLFYSTGSIDDLEYQDKIRESFDRNNIYTDLIVINNVSEEDKKFAKENNISLAKAAYINSIKEEIEIPIDLLIDKPVVELRETKNTGKYCDSDYFLEGDFCLKERERYSANGGLVCPRGYFEYNGICYYETPFIETGKLICDNGELINGECVNTVVDDYEVEYSCSRGELMRKSDVSPIGGSDRDKFYCVDKSSGVAPTLRCLLEPHIILGGKCYVGPAPTINGGCPNNDTLVNGGCYSLDPGDQWQCPNGSIYEKSKGTYVELCPDTLTYIEPTITGYKCSDGFVLKDNKCVKEEKHEARMERICPSGYSMVEFDRCIDYNKTISKIDGYICEGEARVKGTYCVLYDIVDAYHN